MATTTGDGTRLPVLIDRVPAIVGLADGTVLESSLEVDSCGLGVVQLTNPATGAWAVIAGSRVATLIDVLIGASNPDADLAAREHARDVVEKTLGLKL